MKRYTFKMAWERVIRENPAKVFRDEIESFRLTFNRYCYHLKTCVCHPANGPGYHPPNDCNCGFEKAAEEQNYHVVRSINLLKKGVKIKENFLRFAKHEDYCPAYCSTHNDELGDEGCICGLNEIKKEIRSSLEEKKLLAEMETAA
jgi:hypothetical protein